MSSQVPSAIAQADFKPGFIIMNSGDTVHGFINHKVKASNSRQCIFKKTPDAKKEIYTPDMLKAYRIHDYSYHVTMKIETSKIFLEFLVDGIVDLFAYKQGHQETFYLLQDTTLTELSNEREFRIINDTKYEQYSNRYKEILLHSFRDDPKISSKIKELNYIDRSLIDITKEYHSDVCNDEKCIVYTKLTKPVIYFGLKAGWVTSSMRLKESEDAAKDMSMSYGIQFRYSPTYLFYRWSILSGIEVSSNSFSGVFITNLSSDRESKHLVQAKYNIIRIPLTFQYTFPFKKIQAHLLFGYNNVLLTRLQYSLIEIYPSGTQTLYFPRESAFRSYQSGLLVGAGISKDLTKKIQIGLKGDFEYRFPLVNGRNFLDYQYIKSFAISFSCLRKL